MKNITLLIVFITMICFNSFSKRSTAKLKFTYPACTLINESFIKDTNTVKTFVIKSQEEFDACFKITDSHKINFENNMVLVGIVGKDNSGKYMNINGATYDTKNSTLYVNHELLDSPNGTCGKYCVVIVNKIDYKRVLFLNHKDYKKSLRKRDIFVI